MGNKKLSIFAALIAMLLGVAGAQAQVWNSRPNETQVRNLLNRLETRTDTFRGQIDNRLDNSRWNNTNREDNLMAYVDAFENATDELKRNFDGRRVSNADVNQVLNYGTYIDSFMRRNQLANAPERQWTMIRNDLNQLANLYRVSWNWNQNLPPFPNQGGNWGGQNNRLDGTYQLNVSMSDNVNSVINQTISNTSVRNRQSQNLTRRLTAPQSIAIEVRGNQVTMATDFGAPVTLTADGRTITETNARGRTTRTTVSMTGNTLNIVTDGDRNQDFKVSFTATGGNRLRVTRQLYLENQNQLISATSVYDRTSNTASWPNVNPGRPDWNNTPTAGNFYIPNGTRLTAVLRNRIATNVSQAGDRFTMEVTSPSQYSGAIVTGRIAEAERSGRISGRANLSMDFESIQYRGRTYSFAGIIDSAREADGDIINISNEGQVRDGNQTTRTVTRAGIGAALGALIGAITGGGQGAAIGAGVGAGAGAGTVLIQGRDNLQLEAGTEFMITATGPATVGYRN